MQARTGSPSSPGQARAANLAMAFGGGPATPPFPLVQTAQPQGGNLVATWDLPAELPGAESSPSSSTKGQASFFCHFLSSQGS